MAILRKLNHSILLSSIPMRTAHNNPYNLISFPNIYQVSLRLLSSSCSPSKPLYDYSLLHDKGDQTICLAREKLGFKTLPLYIIRKSSIFLYESCTDRIDIARFFEVLKLDDTFNSWFCITRWHVWMVACHCMAEKMNGEKLRNELLKRMWEDVNNRMDKLSYIKRRMKFRLIQQYYAEFNATLFGLDEGLVSDDSVLAGALWRNILGMNSQSIDPIILDIMVHYTRVQLHHLSTTMKTNQFLLNGNFQWKYLPPLIYNVDDKQKVSYK